MTHGVLAIMIILVPLKRPNFTWKTVWKACMLPRSNKTWINGKSSKEDSKRKVDSQNMQLIKERAEKNAFILPHTSKGILLHSSQCHSQTQQLEMIPAKAHSQLLWKQQICLCVWFFQRKKTTKKVLVLEKWVKTLKDLLSPKNHRISTKIVFKYGATV